MATTGQFWFLTLGTAKDARVDYIDVLALSGSNTAGAQHVVVDNNNTNGGTTTDLVSNYPEDVQVDWAAGVYFVVINGDPSLGTGGEILMGHTNSAAAPTVVYTANVNDAINTIQVDVYSHHLSSPGAVAIHEHPAFQLSQGLGHPRRCRPQLRSLLRHHAFTERLDECGL